MNVLILNAQNEGTVVDRLPGEQGEIVLIQGEDALSVSKDPAKVDVVIGLGDCSPGSALYDLMLGWRAHPHTYLVPCWFPAGKKEFEKTRCWPMLAIDYFDPDFQAANIPGWLNSIAEWQQNRMQFDKSGSLGSRSALELATSLCLRRASGMLSIIDDEGEEGRFFLENGNLASASLKHLRGVEAFYEFLVLSSGWYSWESGTQPLQDGEPQSISGLITEGLELIKNGNLLHHFVPDFSTKIERTGSESALDDSATAFYPEQKNIYALINGNIAVSEVLTASPLSRPSTMVLLAKWFSLGDIAIQNEQQENRCRVLVVDDSPLMCKALQAIFAEDPRLELAGVAHDGVEALRLIGAHRPDVVTLDLQMPKMDGLTALKHIAIEDPRPVVVLSAFTKETSRSTYESFKYGAVDVITKPENGTAPSSQLHNRELCDRVLQASNIQLNAVRYIRRRKKANSERLQLPTNVAVNSSDKLIIVLCGAGGFPSLLKLIFAMPDSECIPPTIIATSMSMPVIEALVANLRNDTHLVLKEVSGPGVVEPGAFYFVPKENCCRLSKDGDLIRIETSEEGPRENDCFDELLMSAADSFKSDLAAVVMSGTGEDGVKGMQAVNRSGGQGFALSPGACLRPDLPKRIIDLGYATEIGSIVDLAGYFNGEMLCSDQKLIREPKRDQQGLEGI